MVNLGSAQPLVEGIERLRVKYWLAGAQTALDASALAPGQWARCRRSGPVRAGARCASGAALALRRLRRRECHRDATCACGRHSGGVWQPRAARGTTAHAVGRSTRHTPPIQPATTHPWRRLTHRPVDFFDDADHLRRVVRNLSRCGPRFRQPPRRPAGFPCRGFSTDPVRPGRRSRHGTRHNTQLLPSQPDGNSSRHLQPAPSCPSQRGQVPPRRRNVWQKPGA